MGRVGVGGEGGLGQVQVLGGALINPWLGTRSGC